MNDEQLSSLLLSSWFVDGGEQVNENRMVNTAAKLGFFLTQYGRGKGREVEIYVGQDVVLESVGIFGAGLPFLLVYLRRIPNQFTIVAHRGGMDTHRLTEHGA